MYYRGVVLSFCMLSVLLVVGTQSCTLEIMNNLMNDRFVNPSYNRHLRPVINQEQRLQVNISLTVASFRDLDIPNGMMIVVGNIEAIWNDEQIAWEPEKYGITSILALPPTYAWQPELALLGNGFPLTGSETTSAILLNSSGDIRLWKTEILTASCYGEFIMYPFDRHMCNFVIISARYPWHQVSLLGAGFINLDLRESDIFGKWRITETTGQPLIYEGFSAYRYTVKVKRIPWFLIVHTGVPQIMLITLSILVYVLPVSSGERISVAVSVLLSHIILSMGFVLEIPSNTSRIPFYSISLILKCIVGSLSVAISILVSRLSFKTPEKEILRLLEKVTVFVLRHRSKRMVKISVRQVPTVESQSDHAQHGSHLERDYEDHTDISWSDKPEAHATYPHEIVSWLMLVDAIDYLMFTTMCVINYSFIPLFGQYYLYCMKRLHSKMHAEHDF